MYEPLTCVVRNSYKEIKRLPLNLMGLEQSLKTVMNRSVSP